MPINLISWYKSRRGSVSLTLYSTMLAAFAVILTTNIIVQTFIMKTEQERIFRSNGRYVEYVGNTVDTYLENIYTIMHDLIRNKTVTEVFNVNAVFSDRYSNSVQLQDSIRFTLAHTNHIYDIVIQKKGMDFLFNKDGEISMSVYQGLYNMDGLSLFEASSNEEFIKNTIDYIKTPESSEPLKIISLSIGDLQGHKVTVMVNHEKFIDAIRQSNADEQNEMLIYDISGQLIASTFEVDIRDNIKFHDSGNITLGNSGYIVNVRKSQVSEWEYAILYSHKTIAEESAYINIIFLCADVGLFVVFFLLIMYYNAKIYKPVKRIVDKCARAENRKNNELDAISSVLDRMFSINTSMVNTIKENTIMIGRNIMMSILENKSFISAAEQNKYLGFLNNKEFLVIEFYSNNIIGEDFCSFVTASLKEADIATYVVNIKQHRVTALLFGDKLINGDVKQVLNNALAEFDNEFGMMIVGILSPISAHISELGNLYECIKVVYLRRNITTTSYIFAEEDIVNPQYEEADRPSEILTTLSQLVDKADLDGIRQLRSNIENSRTITSFAKAQKSILQIKRIIRAFMERKELSSYRFDDRILQFINSNDETIDVLYSEKILLDCIESFVEYAILTRNEVEDEIVKYIKDNFKHYISLDSVADHFSMHPNYISGYIKKKINMTFTELINNLRMEYAKKELVLTDKTITEIARELCFENPGNFIRFFKRLESMTPGEYQRSMKMGK